MSTPTITLGETNLVPTREAAKHVSLTHDYIARLAREDKVVGLKVGRQWYVDLHSVERFVEVAETEKQVRADYLRQERQREQQVSQQGLGVIEKLQFSYRLNAMAQVSAVFMLGLLVGYMMYVVSQTTTPPRILADVFQAVTALRLNDTRMAGSTSVAVAPEATVTTEPREPRRSTAAVVEDTFALGYQTTTLPDTPLVLLGESARENDAAYLRSLFSDPVDVSFTEDGRGVVTPQFADGPGEPMEFLLVPNVVSDESLEWSSVETEETSNLFTP